MKVSTAIDLILEYIQHSEMGGRIDDADSCYSTYQNLIDLKEKVLEEDS